MVKIIIVALVAMLFMNVVYWMIKKIAEWLDERSLKKWEPPENIGINPDGTAVFGDKEMKEYEELGK